MHVKTYKKLVRDHIPEIIESGGKTCGTEPLSDARYLEMLDAKLNEELAEYQESKSLEELVRQEKAAKRGGFEKKILLKEVLEE